METELLINSTRYSNALPFDANYCHIVGTGVGSRYNEGSWREGRGAMNAFRWDSVAEDAPCNEIRWSPQIRRLQTIISDRLSISHGLTSPSLLRAV